MPLGGAPNCKNIVFYFYQTSSSINGKKMVIISQIVTLQILFEVINSRKNIICLETIFFIFTLQIAYEGAKAPQNLIKISLVLHISFS